MLSFTAFSLLIFIIEPQNCLRAEKQSGQTRSCWRLPSKSLIAFCSRCHSPKRFRCGCLVLDDGVVFAGLCKRSNDCKYVISLWYIIHVCPTESVLTSLDAKPRWRLDGRLDGSMAGSMARWRSLDGSMPTNHSHL